MFRTSIVFSVLLFAFHADVNAQRTNISELDSVHVTSRASSAAALTRSVEVITHDELDRRAGRSLAEVLSFALGVDVQTRSPAQSDLSLRGSTFNQVVILVDGVRVSDVQSGHYALDLSVPAAMIERIEILRGSGSALYGSDAVGGVVNIVTRAAVSGGSVSTRAGSFGGAYLSGALSGDTHAIQLRGGADVDRSDGHRSGTDYRIVQLRLGAERHVSAGRIIFDAGLGIRQFGAANFYSPFPSDETTRSTTAALRLLPRDDARVSVSGSLHARRHGDLFTLKRDDPAYYQNRHVSHETGGDLSARYTFMPGVVMAAGVDLLGARLQSARLGDHVQTRAGAFGEITVGRSHGATIDAGLRADHLSDAKGFVSPSLAFAVPLLSRARLRGSVTRGFRAATWTERFYVDPANVADSTLAVERFWSHEIGLRASPFAWMTTDVALFERRATDLIDWAKPAGSPAAVPWHTRNFARAIYRGVEATARFPDLLGIDWVVRASGLRFDANTAEGTVGKYGLRPVTRTVGVSAAAPVLRHGMLTMDALRARRTGERDHLQVNARFGAPVRDLRATLDLVNLTGADYLDGAGKAVAGRSVFAGLSWITP